MSLDTEILSEVNAFLGCATPTEWLDVAMVNLPTLLVDHAHCEKKAASTALNLLFRYVDRKALLTKLTQLAREELLHFEQVLELMERHGVQYDHLTPSRYAMGMRQHIRTTEPGRLVDTLIVGAFIEARSCERFESIAPRLMQTEKYRDVGKYYRFLLKSESRHYQDYLALAREYAPECIDDRVGFFRDLEAGLILSPDSELRFHSGIPQ
ncbi:tRNA-(ms[2]io[6]A)-hydroxylase [Ketobacter sp. MCCC 1A13808]|uniref:tRNA-(ms[2]io[6]A)-hydroxylase n=1 Tax=Ketobacter sp. MCCC 1A13808 TaxID=2602738 RepID=UPI0012EBC892|nr:tRNA-(ms[2]io[6]A)-hydroxylase [Ketobacter sp. MCCC 1A13808]MVF12444.1 tRNA-(ms[2]io[6]A)-hydroxylase [Ketobacter sp. MCCC 1A13808]